MAGLVDSHVHVNEPGRTEWEGFKSATRAAAAGGTTTIIDMPLNCVPPTVSVEALAAKRHVCQGEITVDVAFWGGYVPGAKDQMEPLVKAGVCGFKAFLVDSGVDEFPPVTDNELRVALEAMAALEYFDRAAMVLTLAHLQEIEKLSKQLHNGALELCGIASPGASAEVQGADALSSKPRGYLLIPTRIDCAHPYTLSR